MEKSKQLRVTFSGLDDKSEPTNVRERIPQQKTHSFKPDKMKAQNWFRRQLSGKMGHSSSSSDDGEFETVIAASAFAITSLEGDSLKQKRMTALEGDSLKQKRMTAKASQASLTKAKSRKEDNLAGPPDTGKIPRRFTGQASMKKTETVDQKPPENAATNQKIPEKVTSTVPSVRTPTFSETQPNDKIIMRNHDTKINADTWEKAQMAKIEKRYEKQKATILSWENEKHTKAITRLERKERKLDLKRARATQEYRNEMARINKIAGGARALAEERKRNDEVKIKEKAKIIRSTGKIGKTCFCF